VRRREFISLIGSASAAWPLAVRAQQSLISRIDVLMPFSEGDPEGEKWIAALVDGLSELGWKRDKNLRIDTRFAGPDPARMKEQAKELVEMKT
jgi:putative ABC transport system substrate-binding protein